MGLLANWTASHPDLTPKVVVNVEWVLKVIEQCTHPVGSIYLTVNPANPSTYFADTTWVLWGAGRVPVCVDTTQTEFNTVEKQGGAKTHTLTELQMPSHVHAYTTPGFPHYGRNPGGEWAYQQPVAALTNPTGGNQPHNNLQPYITCYMWKRTA